MATHVTHWAAHLRRRARGPVAVALQPDGEAGSAREVLKRYAWLIYLGGMSALSIAYLFGPPLLNSGPVFNAIGTSAVIAILFGTRLNRPKRRLPLYLFALGQAFFVTGDILAYNYQRFFHKELPFPSIADAFYLGVYPLLVGGIMLLIRRRTPGRDTAGLVDSLVLSIGAGVLSWVFLMAPYAHDSSLSLLTKLISIAYPLADILLLTVVVRLAVGSGRRERAFYLLVLGVVALLLTDSMYGWKLLHGGYTTGGLLDGGWIAFYLLWGAAALHPSVRTVTESTLLPQLRLTRGRLAALAGASLVAPSVQAVEFLFGRKIDVEVVALAGGFLFLLVVARMAGLMRMQEQTERRFSSLVQNSSDVVAVIGADTTIRYLSPSVQRVLGYRSSDLLGTALTSIVHPDEQAHVVEFLTGASASAGPELVEFKVRHRNGDWLEAETLRTNLLTDESVRGIVLNTRDISERKAIERQLEHHAFSDPVTGLANRALFRDRVDHALAQGHRAGRTVAVMFMDLDDFKIINDTFGHATGDALLSAVGGRLRECLRDADTAARLGGDEFAILLEDADDRVDAVEVARRILDALDAPFAIDDRQLTIRASVGIAYANGATLGARATEELLRNADVAMYTAKGQGKSQHAVYQPTMHKNMIQRLELRGDLQQALDRSEFELYYQPIINLATREISGIEALVRWQHPRRGTISPADFIPLAEETGVIIPLGSWVLETACQTARGLQTKYPQATSLTVSVNLSSRQLQWPGLVSDVRHALRASGLQPSSLTLEVTESVMMQNIELSVLRLKELKELGVRIAIDDFGTGYSSLNYIRRFPLDILKVDKSFIDHISEDGEELALTSAIIDLANLLHLEPVAEGIERPDQLQRLVDIDCGFGQGYYFATPAPGDVIEQRLAEQHDAAA